MFKRAMTLRTRTGPRSATKRFDRAAESFLEVDARLVAEHLPRSVDVGPRVADVAGARREVGLVDVLPDDPPDRVGQVVHARGRPGGDVEDASARAVRVAGADRCVDDVRDVGEVAGLLA